MRKRRPSRSGPIFLDPGGRRARYTNATLLSALLLSLAGLAVISVGIIWAPPVFQPSINQVASHQSLGQPERRMLSPYEPPFRGVGNKLQLDHPALRLAFYSSYDDNSFRSLKDHADQLDALIPDWFVLKPSGERIVVEQQREAGRSLPWLRENSPHVLVFPQLLLEPNSPLIRAALLDPSKRSALVNEIARATTSGNFSGVTISIYVASAELEGPILSFMRDLSVVLHTKNRKLLTAVDPGLGLGLVSGLAAVSDYVIVLTCDEFPMRGTTGPVASQGWFESQLWKHLAVIPQTKLIVSVGSFGYDYNAFGVEDEISVQHAWDLLAETGAKLIFDGRSLNSTFLYKARDGQMHQVWFNDAVSVFNQLRTALAVAPAGVAIWRLGWEDPSLWDFAARTKFPDKAQIERLKEITPGFGSLEPTDGALVLVRPGRPGAREVHLNPALGLIDDAKLTTIPRLTDVSTLPGVNAKMIALTFDDGPDPIYTPKILDILKKHDVKATFYLVGQNALQNLDVLQRMYVEGHDIGNHTFTHPNLDESSRTRIIAELNATERLFQSKLGITTSLFRAPYESADYGFLDASPKVIETVNSLGYLWGSYNTDTDDYLRLPDQSDWIVKDALRQVHDTNGFHILLMHDAGGNREATVKALPKIIDRLSAEGYEFVTTHELVGLPREKLMPRSNPADSSLQAESTFRLGAIQTLAWIANAIPPIAVITAIIGTTRLVLIIVVAASQHWRRAQKTPRKPIKIGSIAVLVPAHNEEAVVCKTVHALINGCSRRDFEVIVIDDGSTDQTAETVRQTFADEPRVKVFTKPNGGKSSALNFGYGKTSSEIVIAIDGDTILEPSAIERLVEPFRDPSVGAVAGKVVVGNQVNLMTRFQALEYVTSQNLDRTAFAPFNAICVVPGAIGAWRRRAVIEVGGYSDDNLAEDADLTVRLALAGWRVVSCLEARALTEAPESLRGFLRQRFRWMFGMLQVGYKHLGSLFRRPTGISLICIPNIFIFQFGFTLLAPIMDVILFWDLLMGIGLALGLTDFPIDTLLRVGIYMLIFQTADLLAAAVGLLFESDRRYWRLLPLVFLQRFTYRQLLYWTAVKVLLAAIRGAFVGWGRLVRTGNVALPASSPPPA